MIARSSLHPRLAPMAASLAVAVVGRVCGAAAAGAPCKLRQRAARGARENAERCNWRYLVTGALRRWADDPELLAVARAGLGATFSARATVVVRAAVLRLCVHVGTGGWAGLSDTGAVRTWLAEQVALEARARLSGYLVTGLCERWVKLLMDHAWGLLPAGSPASAGALVHETLARFVRDLLCGLATPDRAAAWGRLQEIMIGLQQRCAALEGEIRGAGAKEASAAARGRHGWLSWYAYNMLRDLEKPIQDAGPEDFVQQACAVLVGIARDYAWEGAIEHSAVRGALRAMIRHLISNAARRGYVTMRVSFPGPPAGNDSDETQQRREEDIPAPALPVDAQLEMIAVREEVLTRVTSDREQFEVLLNIFQRVADMGLTIDEAREEEGMSKTRFYKLRRAVKRLLTATMKRELHERGQAENGPSQVKESDR